MILASRAVNLASLQVEKYASVLKVTSSTYSARCVSHALMAATSAQV